MIPEGKYFVVMLDSLASKFDIFMFDLTGLRF